MAGNSPKSIHLCKPVYGHLNCQAIQTKYMLSTSYNELAKGLELALTEDNTLAQPVIISTYR